MMVNVAALEPNTVIDADLCVVGGGACATALSYALQGSGLSVVILESGEDTDDQETRKAIAGINLGPHPFNLNGQRRRVGGGMHDWSGNCSLLDRDDFTSRDAQVGWPILFETLSTYTSHVEKYLGLDDSFPPDSLAETSNPKDLSRSNWHFWKSRPRLFLKNFIRSAVRLPRDYHVADFKDTRLITGATVTALEFNQSISAVLGVQAKAGERQIFVRASCTVLASGLENAPILMRALLCSDVDYSHRLPALGRYLHTHLLSLKGFAIPKNSMNLDNWALPGDLGEADRMHVRKFSGVQVESGYRKKLAMLNGVMFMAPVSRNNPMLPEAVIMTAKALLGKDSVYAIRHYIEQKPEAENRVTLGDHQNALGLLRPEYHWRIADSEFHTINENLRCLSMELGRLGLATVKLDSCGELNNPSIMTRNAHPMGGTVMGHNPSESVVDKDCRVHGFDNVYILGGSVVPRSGAAMLTGILLQLAFRLSDHLVERFRVAA